jgi:phytoene synthase
MRPVDAQHRDTLRRCREILEQNSRSFALAARLLAPDARDRAAAVYAYCRHVDDAIDGAPPHAQAAALEALQRELDAIYGDAQLEPPALRAFQAVARLTGLPRRYPSELLEGMAMDVRGTRYDSLEQLLLYCHRVAGVVGLMMCHVFGITRDRALVHAAHLGMAMQLTNICRDVREDWSLGRLYLPRQLLTTAGAAPLPETIAGELPRDAATRRAMQRVIRQLLAEADRYYHSADRGIVALPLLAGLAVRAARTLYRAIGARIAAQEFDPWRGRAVVPGLHKLWLLGEALTRHILSLGAFSHERLWLKRRVGAPRALLAFPADVLPPLTGQRALPETLESAPEPPSSSSQA